MKAFVMLVCCIVFTVTLYSMAYVTHSCTTEWYCGANMIMLILCMLASIIGLMYSFIEME